MTEAELLAIEDRARSAVVPDETWTLAPPTDDGDVWLMSVGPNVQDGSRRIAFLYVERPDAKRDPSQDSVGAFIAAAHEDVPALVAEVRKQRAALEEIVRQRHKVNEWALAEIARKALEGGERG